MKNVTKIAELTVAFSLTHGMTFEEAQPKVEAVLKAKEDFIALHTTSVGDTVKCLDNEVKDPQYTECARLVVGKVYEVTALEGSMIRVKDLDGSFESQNIYSSRFEKVQA